MSITTAIAPLLSPLHKIFCVCVTEVITGLVIGDMVTMFVSILQPMLSVIWNWYVPGVAVE
ncbi:hypothetical protein D3C72_359830 [compost metagenome]